VEEKPPDDPLPAIREQLARARSDCLALSLLLVEADDPVDVERAITAAAGVDGGAITGPGASGGWLLLCGVVPRRARQLTETALVSAGGRRVAIGIAGYPRHAQSSDALFNMSRRALEQAAASGRAVVVASDDWALEAEDEQPAARASAVRRRSHAPKKRRASRR
jgi:hypothetical protein